MEKPKEQPAHENSEEAQEEEFRPETRELQVEDLDFWTLSFLREHVDMPERIDFNPDEELKKIKKAIAESPREEQSNQRILLMKSFQRRLKILRENMAQVQLELEHFIRENPQADKKELLQTVEEIANRNSISAQTGYFQEAVRLYLQAHINIINTIETYKKNPIIGK